MGVPGCVPGTLVKPVPVVACACVAARMSEVRLASRGRARRSRSPQGCLTTVHDVSRYPLREQAVLRSIGLCAFELLSRCGQRQPRRGRAFVADGQPLTKLCFGEDPDHEFLFPREEAHAR